MKLFIVQVEVEIQKITAKIDVKNSC